MKDITPHISPLIESQFPSFYREEGQVFIAFVKSYYEWMEQENNTLYHARKLLEYRDVDQTVDDFLVYFKEEILKNIQFDVATNKRLLIKNALDFYRSKGTERSIDLFFKLVYAQPASIRYPGDDLLKLSDNTWKIPIYIEVTETPYNPDFEGKQITGVDSGATAFVENYSVKKKINTQVDSSGNPVKISKNIHVFFLSNLRGNFRYGEKVIHTATTDPRNTPVITGSLNQIEVLTGASDYVVGDIVTLDSNTGLNGKAIVTSVYNTTGQVEFKLLEGGWGYSSTPKIIIAEKTLQVNNVITSNSSLIKPFIQFESLVQPKANINFEGMVGTFTANSLIYNYYANNTLSGYGKIISISVSPSNPTVGNLYVSVISGNLQSNARFYNSDNTIYANTVTYFDTTSSANIVALTDKNTLVISDLIDGILFNKSEKIYQSNSTVEWANAIIQTVSKIGSNLVVTVANTSGVFLQNQRVKSKSSQANGLLSYYSTFIGIAEDTSTKISSINITANGANYSNGDLVTISSTSGYGAYARLTTTASGNITAVTMVRSGTGYLTTPSATIANSATQYFFNANSNVSTDLDFITLTGHNFVNSQYVQYKVTATNTALSGLTNNEKYYVRTANSLGIKLSTAPKGSIINLTSGLNENGHSFTAVVSNGYGAILTPVLGNSFDFENQMYVYGNQSNTTAKIDFAGQGSQASFKVASLDDEEPVILNTDFLNSNNIYGANYMDIVIDGSSNSALSGSNSYGFLANPLANLTSGTLESLLAMESFSIGSISLISKTNPGEDYNLDPLVTVIEPAVYGYKKSDLLLNVREGTSGFQNSENLLLISRKSFNGNLNVSAGFISITNNFWANGTIVTYSVDTGNTVIGGLANSSNYYVVQANSSGIKLSTVANGTPISLVASPVSEIGHYIQTANFSKFAVIKSIIDANTLQATRLTMFGEIPEYANTYVKGESSGFISMVTVAGKDSTFSGLNAKVEANVVTANGSVGSLSVLDSGFGYEKFDIFSFSRENDPNSTVGLAKAIVEIEGKGEGFFQNTKGFLSQDKYMQDGDFYQDYSYELVSRVPYERYSEMLKKVLHVAGTKMFPATEVESKILTPITVNSTITTIPYVVTEFDFINYTDTTPTSTFTRASNGTYFDSTGALQTAAINVPRYTYDPISLELIGLMTEPSRTNSIRNNTMVGAVAGTPGTLPTNWTTVVISGITQTIVGTGTESNITYMDVRFFGTPTASSYVNLIPDILIAGSSGQTWTGSFWTKLVAGSLTNTNVNMEIREANASQVLLTNSILNLSVDSILRRYTLTRTLNNAATAFVSVREVCQVTNGLPIDFTIRIGLPQLELGAFPTSVIATSTTAVTRAADFNFVDYNYLDSKISFTRNCPATYFDSSGTLRTASNNSPRYDYNPITKVKRGLLIEEARTNLLTSSFISGAADWTFTGATVTNNSTTSPDGTNTATKIVEDTSSTTRVVQKSATISAGSTLTASVFVKPFSNNRHFRVQVTSNSGVNGFFAYFNLITKTVALQNIAIGTGTAISGSASITEVGNGWLRLACSGTVDPTATTVNGIGFMQNTPTGTAIYTGDGVSGLYIWGAQIEVGSFATSYIPTLDSTVTRLADTALVSGSNFNSGWYYPSDGTLYSEYTINGYAPSSAFPVSTSLTYGTATGNSVILAATNVTNKLYSYSEVKTNTVTQAGFYAGTSASFFANTTIKSAVAYTLNDFAFSTTSVTQQTDNIGTIPTVDRLGIGCIGGSANYLNGWIRKVTYYPVRLSNSELQTLVV